MSTMHGHVADGSCSSQHDILQPKPEDIALFRDKPQEATREFRRLFRIDDPRILGFMYAFPFENPTHRQSQLLWSSGFGVALLEALTDNRWYDSFGDMARDKNFGKFCTSYSLQFQLAIRSLVGFMIMKSPVTTPDRLLDQCRQLFPNLWKLIWRHRDIIFTPQFDESTIYVLESMAMLLEHCCIMYCNQTSQWSPPLESYVGHIALLFLVNPRYLGPVNSCQPGVILLDVLEREGRDALLRERSFLHEVVPSVTEGGKGLVKIIRHNLVRRRPITAEEFRCTLDAISLLLMWGPAMVTPAGEGGYAGILTALAAAAQRYECHGCAGLHTGADYDAVEIPKAFLIIWATLTGNAADKTAGQGVVDEDLAGDPYRFGFTSIIAPSVVAVYKENGGSRKLIVQTVLRSYLAVSRLGREHYHTNRGNWRKYCYLRRVLQVYWLPTLRNILTALRPSDAQTGLSAAERASLQNLLKLWKDLGRAFNLSEKSREDDTSLTSYVTAEELRQGCYFAECLCYGEKPLHGTRRVCKGCWAVYYCGERCQKKDWKAGHRDICRGRSAIADSDRD